MRVARPDDCWTGLHKRILTEWVNVKLSSDGIKIRDIEEDLRNGAALIKLLEAITDRKIDAKWNMNPYNRIEMLENANQVVRFMASILDKHEGIPKPCDIVDGDLNFFMNLVWTIFYNIWPLSNWKNGSIEEKLLKWVNEVCDNKLKVTDFSGSWKSAKPFLAILAHFYTLTGVRDISSVEPRKAFQLSVLAFQKCGIYVYLKESDLITPIGNPDKRAILIQVAEIYAFFIKYQISIGEKSSIEDDIDLSIDREFTTVRRLGNCTAKMPPSSSSKEELTEELINIILEIDEVQKKIVEQRKLVAHVKPNPVRQLSSANKDKYAKIMKDQKKIEKEIEELEKELAEKEKKAKQRIEEKPSRPSIEELSISMKRISERNSSTPSAGYNDLVPRKLPERSSQRRESVRDKAKMFELKPRTPTTNSTRPVSQIMPRSNDLQLGLYLYDAIRKDELSNAESLIKRGADLNVQNAVLFLHY